MADLPMQPQLHDIIDPPYNTTTNKITFRILPGQAPRKASPKLVNWPTYGKWSAGVPAATLGGVAPGDSRVNFSLDPFMGVAAGIKSLKIYQNGRLLEHVTPQQIEVLCTMSTLCTKNDVNMWYKQQVLGTNYGFETQTLPIYALWPHENGAEQTAGAANALKMRAGLVQSNPMTVPAHWPNNAGSTAYNASTNLVPLEAGVAGHTQINRFPWRPYVELRTISPLLNALCEGDYVLPLHLMSSPLQIEIEQYTDVNTSCMVWTRRVGFEEVDAHVANNNRRLAGIQYLVTTNDSNAQDLSAVRGADNSQIYLLWEEYAIDIPPSMIPSHLMVQVYETETFTMKCTDDGGIIAENFPFPARRWEFNQDLQSVSNIVLDRRYLRVRSNYTDANPPALLDFAANHVAKIYPRTYSIDSFDDYPGKFCVQIYHNQRPVYPGAGITSRSQLFQMASELLGNQYTLPTNYIHCPEGQGSRIQPAQAESTAANRPAYGTIDASYDAGHGCFLVSGNKSSTACSRIQRGALQPSMMHEVIYGDSLVNNRHSWRHDGTCTTGNIGMCSGPFVLPLGRLFNDPIHTLTLSFKGQAPFRRMCGSNPFEAMPNPAPEDPMWLTFECIMVTNQIIQFDYKSGEFSFMRVRPEAGDMNPEGDSGKEKPEPPAVTTNPIQQSSDVKS